MTTIVVTGCAGFIGSHLCEQLLKEDYTVKGIDNFDDYYDAEYKKRNLASFIQHKNFKFYNIDVRSSQLENIVENGDIIVHLAARPGVRRSNREPITYIENNIVGTIALLEAARKKDAQQIVFGSTSSVYGLAETPFKEDAAADRPLSIYAATKRSSEIMLYVYSYYYGLPTTILRFFTVYGPRVRPDMAIYKFAKNILEEKPITVYGEGKLKRDYTYVSDTVDGIIKALKKKFSYEIFNIGSGRPVEIIQIVRLLEQNLNKKAKIIFKEKPKEDMPVTYADITKARNLLGYQPKTPLETGIRNFVQWFLNHRKHQNLRPEPPPI